MVDDRLVTMQLWDTAGQERFHSLAVSLTLPSLTPHIKNRLPPSSSEVNYLFSPSLCITAMLKLLLSFTM